MGKSQRTKGAVFEREVCDSFTAALNPATPFKRNIGQARDGGNDIDVGPLVVECKRRKTLGTVYGWLEQATRAAVARRIGRTTTEQHKHVKAIPMVVARQDADTSPIVILRLTDFLILTRDELRAHIDEAAE